MSVINRIRGNSWQFPVLGKYYFGSQRSTWRPFVATGYAFSSTWFHQQSQVTTFSGASLPPQIQPYTSDYRSSTNVGAVFAAGVKYQKGRLAVLPEVRWTHWGPESYPQRRNTGSFLLGLRF